MEFVEPPPAVGPASGKARASIAPVLADELVVGGVAVHLEDAAIAAEMPAHAFSGSAVLKPIGHHGRSAAAEGAVVAGIGPEPGLVHGAGSGREGRKAGLIGEDVRTLQNFAQHMRSEDLQLEAERIAAGIAHQRQLAVRSLADVYRLVGQIDLHSCRAHRTQDPAQRSLAGVRADADHHLAHHDLHHRRWRARRGVRVLLLQEGLAPAEQLRRRNPQTPRQRRNIHAGPQRRRDSLGLELIRPSTTLPDRCSVETLDHSLHQLQATSRRHRRRTSRKHGTTASDQRDEPITERPQR